MKSIHLIMAVCIAGVFHTLCIVWTMQLPGISIQAINLKPSLPVTNVTLVHLAHAQQLKPQPKMQESPKNALHQVQSITQKLLDSTLSAMEPS